MSDNGRLVPAAWIEKDLAEPHLIPGEKIVRVEIREVSRES